MTPIITDKYRITFSNAGDLVCMSIEEQYGDPAYQMVWANVVNIPLPLPQAHEAWFQLNANIDQVEMRVEEEKKQSVPDQSDFWSAS